MTTATTNQDALGVFASFGFEIKEPDDHITELYFKGERIAVYNQAKLTKERLQTDCQAFWNNTIGRE